MSTTTQTRATEAEAALRGIVHEGDTVYTIRRHVSRSGMFRVIDMIVMVNNEPRWIAWNVGHYLGYSHDEKREGLKVSGCGMDMGSHLVYSLSYKLFGNGYKLNHRWL